MALAPQAHVARPSVPLPMDDTTDLTKLAGDFLVTTRQKEDAGLASAGRLIFGDELWQWVDPDNVSRARRDEPGPGRAVLDDILQRLEQA